MADAFTLKICVVGACKAGKTLLSRALAEQPILVNDYSPTAGVRCAAAARDRAEGGRLMARDEAPAGSEEPNGRLSFRHVVDGIGPVP